MRLELVDSTGAQIELGDTVIDLDTWIEDLPNGKQMRWSGLSEEKRKEKGLYNPSYDVHYKPEIAGIYPFSCPAFGGYEWERLDPKRCLIINKL